LNRSEIAQLLTQISALDNRVVDEAGVEMWFRVLGSFDYQDALDALPLFFQKSDSYLAPRGLIVEIKNLREQRAAEEQKRQQELENAEGPGDPMPICAEHGLGILDCTPCCLRLSGLADMHPNDRHAHAVATIYMPA